jgi:maltokinase
MVRTVDVELLEERIRAAGAQAMLPDRLRESRELSDPVTVLDLQPLHGGMLAILRCGDDMVATPLVGGPAAPRRARPGDGVFAALVRAIARDETAGGFASRRLGTLPIGDRERAIAADQSNESAIVDESVIVKLYPFPSPGPHPAIDIPTHLDEVGFDGSPPLVGSLVWSGDGEADYLVATATEVLPGARDGWDWHVELLEEIADGGRPPVAWARPAAALGALVARLHAALAMPSSVFATPRALATGDDVVSWMRLAEATLDEALALTDGPEGERLRQMEPSIRRSFGAVEKVTSTPITKIHGDLHVGQTLPWAGGFAVIDFEGNPLQAPDERGALRSPARDVASMVRALDHVGRIVEHRRSARSTDLGSWVADARAAFLDAYRNELGARGMRDLFDERFLHPFEVAQECHEYVYAARYLPRWRYVPDLAMPVLLDGG